MIRDNIQAMSGYTPGEQPRASGIVKLNTNENPYPPSPAVVAAIQAALTGDNLRKYPDPSGLAFRHAAAKLHGVDADSILIGNGSDDILTILTRAFVPQGGLIVSATPSYLLYRTLAEIQGSQFATVPFTADWDLPNPWPQPNADITLLANPNSPSGTQVNRDALRRLAAQLRGPLVIDEAYVDFADEDAVDLVGPNVIITRTLSKSYSLAGIRFGYAIAPPSVVAELNKVKDSYNCDVLSLAAATAAIQDQEYRLETRSRILKTREHLAAGLQSLGFQVTPSHANFVWCQHPNRPAKPIYEALKTRNILVRYMQYEGFGDGLRITVGTDIEVEMLFAALAAEQSKLVR